MLPRPSRLDATFQYRHHGLKERNYQANDMQIADGQLTVFAGYEWRCWLGILQGPMVFVGLWPIGVRIGINIIDRAEREGLIKPGGTIVEATSGNTGMGLALVAAVRGYKCIFVMPDKISEEKAASLRAVGARVVITPTNVEADDPRSYYSVSRRIADETPNAFYANQYFNPANPESHYLTTGPEIWEQTQGEIDVFVSGLGTGGTISGTGVYL